MPETATDRKLQASLFLALLCALPAFAQFDSYTATLDPAGSFWNATTGFQNCSGAGASGIPNTPLASNTLTLPIQIFYGNSPGQCGSASGTWTITLPASPFNFQMQDRGNAPSHRFLASAPIPIQTSIHMNYLRLVDMSYDKGMLNYFVRGITELPDRDSCRLDSSTPSAAQDHSQTCNPTLLQRMASFNSAEKPEVISGGVLMTGLSNVQALVFHLTLIPNSSIPSLRYDVFLRYNLTAAGPPPPSASLSVHHIEVVQVVQDTANTIPLIAKKRTVVRVFPKVTNAPFLENVTGTLTATKDGNPLNSYSPLSPHNASITAKENPSRESEFDSLDFLLPPGWTDQGEFQVTVNLRSSGGLSAQAQLPKPVLFLPPREGWPNPLFIGIVPICLQRPGDETLRCPSDSIRFRTEFLQKLLPLPDDGIWFYPIRIPPLTWKRELRTTADEEAVLAMLNRFYQFASATRAAGAVPRLDMLVGVLPSIPENGTKGYADPVWTSGQGRVFYVQDIQDAAGPAGLLDFLHTSFVVAHEAGHNLGLEHVPTDLPDSCGSQGINSGWLYPNGKINEVGYDPEKMKVIPASKFDLMGYCSPPSDNIWISPYHYTRLANLDGRTAFNRPRSPGNAITVEGIVRKDGGAELKPAYETIDWTPLSPSDPAGEYCVALETASGNADQRCFSLIFQNVDGSELAQKGFLLTMLTSAEITRIVLRRAGVEIASTTAGLQRPVIQIDSPAPGNVFPGGPLQIAWSASDPDNDPLSYAVEYAVGDDGPFYLLAYDLTATSYTIDTSLIPNGTRFAIRILASDGIHTSAAYVDTGVTQNVQLALATPDGPFGDVLLGRTATLKIVLANSGDGTATVTSASTDSPLFTAALSPGAAVIPAKGSTEIPVTFRPDALGPASATLTITTSDENTPTFTVPLSGRGVDSIAPNLQLSPASLDFGEVNAATPATLTLSLRNAGNARLVGTSITSSGPPFTVVEPTGSLLIEPHTAIQARVRFEPAVNGPAAGTLTVSSNDPSNPTLRVPLTGTGAGAAASPAIALPSGPVDYGSVTVGQTKSLDVLLRNTGAASLTVNAITSSDPQFTISLSLPQTIPAGAQLTVPVLFRPTAAGARSATLTIASNDPLRPSATIALSGAGLAVAATYQLNRFEIQRSFVNDGFNPWSVAPLSQSAPAAQRAFPFGWNFKWPDNSTGPNLNQASASVTFTQIPATVTPGAGATLATTVVGDWNTTGYGVDRDHTIRLEGAAGTGEASFMDSPSGVFRHQFNTTAAPNAPQPDAAGEISFNLTATLRFGSDHTATMTVRVVYSTAAPQTGPVAAVSAMSLDFGSVAAGQRQDRTLTLSNTGTAALNVTSLRTTGVFAVVSPAAPFTVAAGAASSITLRYSPIAAGSHSGSLAIQSNAPAITVALSGTATAAPPAIALPSTALDYGSVTLGQTKSLDLIIRNTGASNLTISAISSSDPQFTHSTTLPQTIPANGQLTVPVVFRPSAAGQRSATLTITSNDPARSTATLALSGTGALPTTYQLNRFEIRRSFINDGFNPWTVAPLTQSAPPAQRAFPFGWNYKWPDNATGPNLNQVSSTVTFIQIPASLTPGSAAAFATTVVGDWNTTGYGVDRDHTIRLEGAAGTGEASFMDSPSGVFRHQFSTAATPNAPQPDAAGEISFNITANLRFGSDHTATMTVRIVYTATPPR
ncbi:MAG: choice-of-anchor D domain-containing protein [Acidobacteria bacterium]|nr:choice-of-anchor D domain-containing protein [Acidobacteriota bacterium]